MRMKTIKMIMMVSALTACGTGGSMNGDDTTKVDAPIGTHDAPNVTHDAPAATGQLTIFTIVMENHDYAEIVGSSNAPYINSLIAQGALATNYKDTNHPSLPNYLHMISGADQYPGFIDIGPAQWPYFPAMQDHLGTQLEAAHVKWRSYQESMGTACNMTDAGSYATKHDPFLYFTDMTSVCADTNVDYSNFAADLASKQYRYMWITPNLTSDGHDPATDPVMGMQTSDHWLSVEVPKILASDAYNEGGIIFITWDEAEARNGDDPDKIPMIIISKKVKTPGMTSATAFDHGSYLATVEDLLTLPRLATVSASTNLMEFLNH
jgi:phosphatidylinositol-3-phosphatase